MQQIDAGHAGAVLEIDLTAVRANWRLLADRLGTTACGAVVKADAYGLGAATVVPALVAEGARNFFTAHLDEALALVPLLPGDASLFVLNGLPAGAEADCAAAGILPVLNSLGQVEAYAGLARRLGRALPAVLQVDSGMSRLGLDRGELERIAENRDHLAGLDLRLVMSHLACAERQDHPMNAAQLARFSAACRQLPAAPASLANSSGIFLGPDFHFNLARPGAALYGLAPVAGAANPMRPTVRLLARIIQTRETRAGDAVGYGARWTAPGPRRVATVAVGYADGYLRSLSGQATAFSGDVPVPLVGTVSMDSTTFDVTDAPEAVAGGFLELIGPRQAPDTVATAAGTIGYEILTALGRRYDRRYLTAPQPERCLP